MDLWAFCSICPVTPSLPLAPSARRPFDRRCRAPDSFFPRRADTAQKIDKNVRGATGVGAMDDDDVRSGERHAGIGGGQTRIVPLGEFAKENVGD